MMNLPAKFSPPRRRGLIIHAAIAGISILGGGTGLFLAFDQPGRGYFPYWIAISLILLLPLPVIIYRGYALYRALYTLERDGLRLRWGLRFEDIPLPNIEWIRPAGEMGFHIALPLFNLPGGILGTRRIEGLGLVEFVAAEQDTMLLIATPGKVYAISPTSPNDFMRAFKTVSEMGSLSPIVSQSGATIQFISQAWKDRFLRTFFIASLWLTILLLILVNVYIPQRSAISLGFNVNGTLLPPGPSQQLILLPILAGFTFVFDLVVSLFFYRRKDQRFVAYLISASSVITPILLVIALLFLV
jgi:Bacterial PH domain